MTVAADPVVHTSEILVRQEEARLILGLPLPPGPAYEDLDPIIDKQFALLAERGLLPKAWIA